MLRERDLRILGDYLAGMKRSEIAAKYGVVRSTVYHRVETLLKDPLGYRLPADLAAKLKKINALKAKLKELQRAQE